MNIKHKNNSHKSWQNIILLLFILILLALENVYTQGYYPLSMGTKWNYLETRTYSGSYRYSIEVIGDSLFANGHTYAKMLRSDGAFEFKRQNNGKVFYWNVNINSEQLEIDYNNSAITIDTVEILGRKLRQWSSGVTWTFSYGQRFIDSIGLTYNYSSSENGIYTRSIIGMRYDTINYGDLTFVQGICSEIGLRKPSLLNNYPNPFNPSTTISYSIPERCNVNLTIFNTLSQQISEIVNETKDAGSYEQSFNASQLSSGIYFYRIEATPTQNYSKTYVETKKMILMK